MARAIGANALMNLAFETTYGTPPTSGFRKLQFVMSELGAEQGLIESDLLGLGRAPTDPTYDVVNNDGNVTVPLDLRNFGYWLRLMFGLPVTTGSGPYVHTFASGGAALPSASIEIGHPDRPSYGMNYGMCGNSMQLQMQRSGLINAQIGLVGKGETVPATTSSAGSPTTFGLDPRFAQASGAILIDTVQIGEVLTASLNFTNNLEKDETIKPDGEINGVDPGMPSVALSMTTKFADHALLTKATSQVPVAIQLGWAFASGFTLTMTAPRVFLPRVKKPVSGPRGVQATFNGIGATASNGNSMLVVALTNDVTGYAA